MEQCRHGGSSFHVDYTINEDGHEKQNLTHAESTNSDEIAEREEEEVGWVVELDGERIGLTLIIGDESPDMTLHSITADTAEQLADMFSKIAVRARNRIKEAQANREALEREAAEIATRQIDLFAKTTIN